MESNALALGGLGVWLILAIGLIATAIILFFPKDFDMWDWFWKHVWPDLTDAQQDELVKQMREYVKQNAEKKR